MRRLIFELHPADLRKKYYPIKIEETEVSSLVAMQAARETVIFLLYFPLNNKYHNKCIQKIKNLSSNSIFISNIYFYESIFACILHDTSVLQWLSFFTSLFQIMHHRLHRNPTKNWFWSIWACLGFLCHVLNKNGGQVGLTRILSKRSSCITSTAYS